ncbi:MAG TPA: sigma-70 family RNA polymerase sigma factor [Planctomycetota bacterium]|nr:sigma-70 family RNA polymerase sigma factor [Planctomycetota bacterium]
MSEGPIFISDILPEHVRFVRAVAHSLLDEHEAEDAVQDTLLRALEQPPEPGNIRGWLRVVVRNFALRRKREEKRRKRREALQAPPDRISTPAESLARIEGQQRVLEAVRELPEPYRSMVVHHYLDELTREQIAARLGIPLETVRTRLRRALRLLRERLDRDDASHGWIAALLPLLAAPRPHPPGPSLLHLLATKIVAGAAILGCGALLLAGRDGSYGQPRAAAEAVAGTRATHASATMPEGSAETPDGAGQLLVSCLVRDATGAALEGAHAVAADGSARDTGPDGIFRLVAAATDGRLRVSVRKPGYLPWQGVLDAMPGVEQSITLLRGAALSVLVKTAAGAPVAGASVRASAREERGIAGLWWSRRLSPVAECVSDPAGRASLGAAPEGKVEIRIDDPRYASWSEAIVVAGTEPVLVEAVLSGGGRVSGRITDGNGKPVARAKVYAAAWPARAAFSSEDGTYDLGLVEAGECRILAEADGFGIGYFGAGIGWGKPVPVRVTAGRATADIDVVLPAAIDVRGRVVDEDGLPLAGVRVDGCVGPCSGRPVAAATGDLGIFSIGPFAETDGHAIRLTLGLEGYRIDPVDVDPRPGTLDLGDLRARKLWGVRGRVLDVDGGPPGKARVEVLPRGPAAIVAADGTFVLQSVPEGTARIRASAWGPARGATATVEVEPGGIADGLEIRLGPALPIRGHVFSRAGRPRAGVAVGAVADEGGEEPAARATSDANGAFELKALPQGPYRVGILRTPLEEETAAPNTAVDFTDDAVAVRIVVPGYESEAAEAEPVLLPDPRPERALAGAEDVALVLSRSGTVVDGTVVSRVIGGPLPSFEASFIEYWHGLIPRGSETLDVRDDRGRFEYELDEGDWAVEITTPGHASVRTPVFHAGARATLSLGTIALGAGGRLRGAIRDAGGEPVPYARLYLLGPQMQTNRQPIFTDAEGAYDARCITPGAYTVFVLSPRHPLGIVRCVQIAENEMSPLDVRLDRASPVTILVKDDAGQPVAGADVSYTCDALFPLTSRLLRSHEPPGWGGYLTDDHGRLEKAFLPAGRVMFSVRAPGFAKARRVVELRQDCDTLVEIRLERQG